MHSITSVGVMIVAIGDVVDISAADVVDVSADDVVDANAVPLLTTSSLTVKEYNMGEHTANDSSATTTHAFMQVTNVVLDVDIRQISIYLSTATATSDRMEMVYNICIIVP